MSSSDTESPELQYVIIDGTEIPLVEPSQKEQRALRKQNLPIRCKADKSGWAVYLLHQALRGEALIDARRVNRIVPRWGNKCMPVALFMHCRDNRAGRKIVRKCSRLKRPVVLIYMDGGLPGKELSPHGLISHLGVRSNVIVFAWSNKATAQQIAVLNFLYAHWQDVFYDAMGWLRNRTEIPFFAESPE